MSREPNNNHSSSRRKILLILVFVLGLSIFLYPTISNFIVDRKQEQIIKGYQADVERLKAEEKKRLREEAEAYNRRLMHGTVIEDPFAINRPQESGISYMDMLNIGEVMAYLEIPDIDVYLPIYHGTSDDVLNNGLGHIEQTSLPVGGSGTNSVITGHRGLPTALMFRNLNELKAGEIFYLHSLDEVLAYRIFETVIVPPNDIERLRIDEDRDLVTLVTCDPYMINTNRLLVRGERTDYVPPPTAGEGTSTTTGVASVPSQTMVQATIPPQSNTVTPQPTAGTPSAPGTQPLLIGLAATGVAAILGWLFWNQRKQEEGEEP
ncbi:MAG: class C sortase [Clostridiaceae bacterium]